MGGSVRAEVLEGKRGERRSKRRKREICERTGVVKEGDEGWRVTECEDGKGRQGKKKGRKER